MRIMAGEPRVAEPTRAGAKRTTEA
jgi:hypothetical protein